MCFLRPETLYMLPQNLQSYVFKMHSGIQDSHFFLFLRINKKQVPESLHLPDEKSPKSASVISETNHCDAGQEAHSGANQVIHAFVPSSFQFRLTPHNRGERIVGRCT